MIYRNATSDAIDYKAKNLGRGFDIPFSVKDRDMLEYDVVATRNDTHGSSARCKGAEITLDTDTNGRQDAFNPAELFLAAIAACMIKGIERVASLNHFKFNGVEVRLHGIRQDSPPFMESISYELIVDTSEDDRRLDLIHYNVQKYGTIFNTVSAATKLACLWNCRVCALWTRRERS